MGYGCNMALSQHLVRAGIPSAYFGVGDYIVEGGTCVQIEVALWEEHGPCLIHAGFTVPRELFPAEL